MPTRARTDEWREIAESLGLRVRQIRLDHDMTQEELAHAAGISRNQVQNIERSRNNVPGTQRGPGNPRLDTLFAISRVLEIELVQLLPPELGGPSGALDVERGDRSKTV